MNKIKSASVVDIFVSLFVLMCVCIFSSLCSFQCGGEPPKVHAPPLPLSAFVVQVPFCCEGPHLSLFVFISSPVMSHNLCFRTPEFQTLPCCTHPLLPSSAPLTLPTPPSSYLPLHSHTSRSRFCLASPPPTYLPISSTSPCHSHGI